MNFRYISNKFGGGTAASLFLTPNAIDQTGNKEFYCTGWGAE
jgi:hypothetical protein